MEGPEFILTREADPDLIVRIDSLSMARVSVNWGVGGMVETCAVCQEEVTSPVRLQGCNHGFHGYCIVPWLQRNRSCPLCRFRLPFGSEADEEEGRSEVEEGSDEESEDGSEDGRSVDSDVSDDSLRRERLFRIGMRTLSCRFATRENKNLKREYDRAFRVADARVQALLKAHRDLRDADSISRGWGSRISFLRARFASRLRRESVARMKLDCIRQSVEAVGSRHIRFLS